MSGDVLRRLPHLRIDAGHGTPLPFDDVPDGGVVFGPQHDTDGGSLQVEGVAADQGELRESIIGEEVFGQLQKGITE